MHIQPSSVCLQRATVMTSSESGHLYKLGTHLGPCFDLKHSPFNPWRTLPEHPPHMQKRFRRHGNREENEKAILSPCVPSRISCSQFICTCWTSYAASLPYSTSEASCSEANIRCRRRSQHRSMQNLSNINRFSLLFDVRTLQPLRSVDCWGLHQYSTMLQNVAKTYGCTLL